MWGSSGVGFLRCMDKLPTLDAVSEVAWGPAQNSWKHGLWAQPVFPVERLYLFSLYVKGFLCTSFPYM